MRHSMTITNGKAVLTAEGLRCRSPRNNDPSKRACNKLLVLFNQKQQIAGCFKCERCKGLVEVEVVLERD